MNVTAELDPPLEVLEAELAAGPPPPWRAAIVLPDLCPRGHPRRDFTVDYGHGPKCLRCKHLLEAGRALPYLDVVYP